MSPTMAPAKTAAGHAELAHRTRGLSQRHRTVLLLVDGRRSLGEVRELGALAGVPDSCFDELVELGLVRCDPVAAGESTLLPPVESLWPEPHDADADAVAAADRPLEEARGILLRALRNEAPLSGSLTMLKLRRAAGRDDVEALLDEVEQRIRKPRKLIVAAQTLRHVRHLLSLPAEPDAET